MGSAAASAAEPPPFARAQPVANRILPPPLASDLSSAQRTYYIGPYDKLVIDVFGIPELAQREIQTDASGRVSFPLAGQIDAVGKTPAELAAAIAERLRAKHIRNPQVTVNLRDTVSQIVTVDGEVREPGSYPVMGHMTLLRAVASAKGTTDYAKQSQVLIFRTVAGQDMAGLYNLKQIRRGVYADPEVFPNDVVVVGDSAARRLLRDAVGVFPAIASPVLYLLLRR